MRRFLRDRRWLAWAGQKRFWLKAFVLGGVLGIVGFSALVIHYDRVVREKFEGKRWAIPAKVFARPLELYVGQVIGQEAVLAELKRLQYKSVLPNQTLRPGQYQIQGDTVRLVRRGFQFWDGQEPTLPLTVTWSGERIERLAHSDSRKSVPLVRLDALQIGGIYPTHGEDRHLVALSHVPKALIDGLIVIEDQQFYEHAGVSWRGIARAAWVNLTSGRLRQGGSTLTQQLVKNFYLTSERTLSRKFREMIMAMLLEFHYEKDEILEAYLNEVFLGQAKSRAIHGVGLASQFYFGVPASELSVEQSALLIAMVKGASYYNPRRHPERAQTRRDLVLDEMLSAGVITEAVHAEAKSRGLGVLAKPSYSTKYYPAYINLVKRQLRDHYEDADLRSEGLRLFTSLDPAVQHAAEAALQEHLSLLEQRFPSTKGIQGAVVVASVQHGDVLALVGGRQVRYQGFNRALDAQRQIGSLVKPAVLLAALESDAYHLGSVVSDAPIAVTLDSGGQWSPTNYDNKSHGDVTLLRALQMSYNQSMVRLGMEVGVKKVMSVLNRLGLEKTPSAVPSRLLGAIDAAPIDVVAIYQTIANNGFSNPPKAIRTVLNAKGQPLSRYDMKIKQAFDEADISQVQYALTRVMAQGTGRSYLQQLPDFKAAGKTGTSDDQRDAWFAGFSEDYVVAVWVGFDDNRKTSVTGSSAALPIWTNMMKRLNAKSYHYIPAPDLKFTWMDPIEQARSAENCEHALYLPLPTSAIPSKRSRCAAEQQSPVERVKEGIRGWLKKIF